MSDDIALIINGASLSGWQSVRVTRGIERCPNDFSLAFTESYPGQSDPFLVHPGEPAEVAIAGDIVVTGFIDSHTASIASRSHGLAVTGRGSCQDLVDCSAEWPGGQIRSNDVKSIAEKLALPYGIRVVAQGDTGARLPMLTLNCGQTAFDIIETVCRYRALLAYELPEGQLFIGPVDRSTQATGGVAEGDGGNVQSASLTLRMDNRYSDYQATIVSADTLSDPGTGGFVVATASDPGVPRHRLLYFVAEAATGGLDIARQRALWEAARRIGRAQQLRVIVDSWRDAAGDLWTPNTLVPIEIPSLHLPRGTLWTLSEVTYHRDGAGTHADLLLMPPDAFEPQPIALPASADIPFLRPVRVP